MSYGLQPVMHPTRHEQIEFCASFNRMLPRSHRDFLQKTSRFISVAETIFSSTPASGPACHCLGRANKTCGGYGMTFWNMMDRSKNSSCMVTRPLSSRRSMQTESISTPAPMRPAGSPVWRFRPTMSAQYRSPAMQENPCEKYFLSCWRSRSLDMGADGGRLKLRPGRLRHCRRQVRRPFQHHTHGGRTTTIATSCCIAIRWAGLACKSSAEARSQLSHAEYF